MQSQSIKFNKDYINKSKFSKFQDFHNLMSFRVRDIILVSSMYDSYIFEEDGRLYELIRKEYQGLNLSHSPELVQVSSGEEAIELAKRESRFNLIITTQHIEDMTAIELAKMVKKKRLNIPIVLLGYDNREMIDVIADKESKVFDKIFIWQGDFRIIFGIIKYIEDRINIEYDTNKVGVQVIILIEDSIRFYSSYLPLIYTQVVRQAQRLISEGINLSHKFLRMRARPKIILCSNYEEAWKYYKKYEEHILGIISDVDFKKKGIQDPKAGIKFAKKVKKEHPDIPILLQSNVIENNKMAHKIGASFLLKRSPTLLQELTRFMNEQFSFGEFVFRTHAGKEVGRAKNLKELEDQLKIVPEDSIAYHSERNHFSNWLKARTEFWLAYQLRPRTVSDFPSVEALRQDLINSVSNFRKDRERGIITDFDKESFANLSFFSRIGGGSIGGKARGLGFINNLLSNFNINRKFEEVEIFVPTSVVIGTDVFDQFLDENDLRNFALNCEDDDEIKNRFVEATKFSFRAIRDLKAVLKKLNEPLAVRSSSLLEDSQGQPFAGVYDTFMIPNNHTDSHIRLAQLVNTIKEIYASTFFQRSKDYIKMTTYRLEEEKMAVIVQKMVGAAHAGRFYPEVSGVGKSFNFYPALPLKSNDGIVSAAFGLGKTIVEGGSTLRFCPKYPHHLQQLSTLEDTLNYSQQKFYALDLNLSGDSTVLSENNTLVNLKISDAEPDGTLPFVCSTYSHQNHTIYDGTSRDGVRLFTLAPILKYRVFPLPEIVELILEVGRWGMGSPIEIEFAVNLDVKKGELREFGLLQMRPLVISNEIEELDLNGYSDEELICRSDYVLGNGVLDEIHDIVFVDINDFERSKSREAVTEIAYFNSKLLKENRGYLLIGVGRWGSLDPWLGIPVTWEQISGAKAIIESNFKDFDVQPSQGSHFFQNLTSFKVGYFTVNDQLGKGYIDWAWLENHPFEERKTFTRHVSLNDPITIKINGIENRGVIIKPNSDKLKS